MNYPDLSRSLRIQVSDSEWNLIKDYVEEVDTLVWFQNEKACTLLENAAKKAIDYNYYKCAAKILYYYDNFFAA